MRFPNDYPDQQAVIDYLKQSRDGFVNVAKMPGVVQPAVRARRQGHRIPLGHPARGTQSVVFTMWQNVGGVHPQTFYKSFNWDSARRRRSRSTRLFKPGTNRST